ncbi:Rdx family-domain-containing protein [Hyaloraphidium curvatum]|nr:Rdx family-domain-containing protein [Hyaloraphidium curvatum]
MNVRYPRLAVFYCPKCKWGLRASYTAQEFLESFADLLGEVALVPGASGQFTITVRSSEDAEAVVLWDRKAAGGFENQPTIAQLKKQLRDIVAPTAALPEHVVRAAGSAADAAGAPRAEG